MHPERLQSVHLVEQQLALDDVFDLDQLYMPLFLALTLVRD